MRPFCLNRKFAAALAAAGLLTAGTGYHALAATATANLGVSASVSNNCTITTGAMSFGSYDPVSANSGNNLDGAGRVTIACTKGATATVGLNNGGNGNRRLAGPSGNFLSYELYQDSGHSTVWNADSGVLSTGVAPSKAARDFTVYGRIAPNQDVPAGSYSDTITATVNF